MDLESLASNPKGQIVTSEGRSFINPTNNVGPITKPCISTDLTGPGDEIAILYVIHCVVEKIFDIE